MGNNLFGQYSYKNTLIHRLDPRVKILLVVFISIVLSLLKSYYSFIISSIFIIFLIIISKIKLINLLRSLRPFLFFFVFIFLMYLFFARADLNTGIATIWKFTLLIVIASILIFSTSISQLIYAIEKLFMPLKIAGISPRNIAVMISATIRFIPLLFLEANKVRDAQKSRGADLKKVKHIYGLVSSLLRKTFNKAANLADAIESRCYRDYKYSHFKELKLKMRDYISVLFTISIAGVLLWAS